MVKHSKTIRRQKPTNCFSVFDHFWGLALEGLIFRVVFRTLQNIYDTAIGENSQTPLTVAS